MARSRWPEPLGRNSLMPSSKLLNGVAHDILHHAMSGLSCLHPHLSQTCRTAGVTEITLDLMRESPCQPASPIANRWYWHRRQFTARSSGLSSQLVSRLLTSKRRGSYSTSCRTHRMTTRISQAHPRSSPPRAGSTAMTCQLFAPPDRPNEAHSVDAPIAVLFHIVYQWRRATDAQRYAERNK